jgi:hypothetical protein
VHIRKAKEKYVLLGLVSFSRASFSFAARRQPVLALVSAAMVFQLLAAVPVVVLDPVPVVSLAVLDPVLPVDVVDAAVLDQDALPLLRNLDR